jgi:hypothetical protein
MQKLSTVCTVPIYFLWGKKQPTTIVSECNDRKLSEPTTL